MNASVIICTCNSAKRIRATISGLLEQKTPEWFKWEVIVADYQSADNTLGHFREMWNRTGVPLRILAIEEAGKSAALTRSFDSSEGAILAIIDDDNIIGPNFIYKAHKIINRHEDVGIIGTLGVIDSDGDLPPWFSRYQGVYGVGPQAPSGGYVPDKKDWFWGAGTVLNAAVWRKLRKKNFNFQLSFSRPNGITFASGTGGEDVELCLAVQLLGYKLWYEPTMQYRHCIAHTRFSEKYICNTIYASSKALPVLNIYRSAVRKKNRKLFQNIKESWCVSVVYYAIGALLKLARTFIRGESRLERKVQLSNYRGILYGYYMFRKDLSKIKGEVVKLSGTQNIDAA